MKIKFIPLLMLIAAALLAFTGCSSEKRIDDQNAYNTQALLKYKTPYVGDNSKVVHLIDNLPYAGLLRGEVSLKTNDMPYGITVKYNVDTAAKTDIRHIEAAFRNNAAALFALIDNVDVINFNLNTGSEERKYKYTRAQLQQGFHKDLREYAKDGKALEALLNNFALKLFAYPEKYAMTMSSTPGIFVLAQYDSTADKVQYSTTWGKFLTWDKTTGKINECGKNIELPLGHPIYWSSLEDTSYKPNDKISVKAAVLNKNVMVAEKQMNIEFEPATHFFTVQTSSDVFIAETGQIQP